MYKQLITIMILFLSLPIIPAKDDDNNNDTSSISHYTSTSSHNPLSSNSTDPSNDSTENSDLYYELPNSVGYALFGSMLFGAGAIPTTLFFLAQNYVGAGISGAVSALTIATCLTGPQIYKACKTRNQGHNLDLEV